MHAQIYGRILGGTHRTLGACRKKWRSIMKVGQPCCYRGYGAGDTIISAATPSLNKLQQNIYYGLKSYSVCPMGHVYTTMQVVLDQSQWCTNYHLSIMVTLGMIQYFMLAKKSLTTTVWVINEFAPHYLIPLFQCLLFDWHSKHGSNLTSSKAFVNFVMQRYFSFCSTISLYSVERI